MADYLFDQQRHQQLYNQGAFISFGRFCQGFESLEDRD